MEHRKLSDSKRGQGVVFETHGYTRLATTSVGGAANLHYARETGMVLSQLAVRLEGGSAYLQTGALQYMRGQVQMKTVGGGGGVGGLLARAITAAGTGESAYKNEFSGHGVVWTEPTFKHLILASLDDPNDTLIIDDGAFYACETSLRVGRHVHSNLGAGLLGGEGLMQSKLSGAGVFVLESPVPLEEIDFIELNNDTLVVDGDLVLAYSATLDFRIEKAQKGLLNSYRSGEGLVHVFRGSGQVWVTPTLGLGKLFDPTPTLPGKH
ncbi:uncharacterized protein (AIM24 family) [Deinobacterium chartae]|uniref:Uncharacterized protein (AIM24 family) n=1 Tax=Deinobacterium chartae TaxID=521158 RepID=A0A841HX82_9DEIO|nr:AIM24 family protein [Deinobacterium chartae]MBB6097526.1 uncharacterized protein (AIM24 family) [Deinobacterium chartae]